jgi:hypothetical protein
MHHKTDNWRVTCGLCRHWNRISGMKGTCDRAKLFNGVLMRFHRGNEWETFKFDSCSDAEPRTRYYGQT